MKFILIVTTILLVVFVTFGSAQIPRALSYQGVMTDSSGNPKPDGVYSFVFRLYDTSSGGAELWSEYKDIELNRGLFSTQLGEQAPFDPHLNFTQQYWLSIQFERDAEMLPRIPLSSVAYSFNSIKSDSSQIALSTVDGAITTSKLGDFAVTAIKISDNAITSGKIADGTIQSVDIGNGEVVKSLNGLRDHIYVNGAGGATVTTSGDSLIINAGGGGGGTGIQGVQNTNNTLDITNPNGPTATINLKLPLSVNTSTSAATLSMSNLAEGVGIYGSSANNDGVVGRSSSASKSGVWGDNTGGGHGVAGSTSGNSTAGVWGSNLGSGYGVRGTSSTGIGLYGVTNSTDFSVAGVRGEAASSSGQTIGVEGISINSPIGTGVVGSGRATGGYFQATESDGTGVYGVATATSGFNYGVRGESASSTIGRGVYGYATATSGITYGGYFRSDSPEGKGAFGHATASTGEAYGLFGRSDSYYGRGLYGYATNAGGPTYGVYGRSDSPDGYALAGYATATSGDATGVFGQSYSPNGKGVWGYATASDGVNYGGWFASYSPYGYGVYGWNTTSSGNAVGVYGKSNSSEGFGVWGDSKYIGVLGGTTSGTGVYGYATAESGRTDGVYGTAASDGGYGVYSGGRFAASGTKSFQMDHPLQPETHYLSHFCTEGPDPYNAYSGNIATDAQGLAVVQMPEYFEDINRDFRYQLTCIGQFAQAIVAEEVKNNRFTIKTDVPNVKVSWRVEAVRNDLWVQRYGYRAEQEKESEIKGKYINPLLYGQPKERAIHYRPEPEEIQK